MDILDTFTVEKQNIYICMQKLQIPSGLGTSSKLVVEHIAQGLFILFEYLVYEIRTGLNNIFSFYPGLLY